MSHVFLTIAIPLDATRVADVEFQLDQLGNPAVRGVRDRLRDKGIHFMSMSVVPGEMKHGPFWVLEASADEQPLIDNLIKDLGNELCVVARAAKLVSTTDDQKAAVELRDLMKRHQCPVGQSLFSTPGLCFTGTPGMSLTTIRDEYELGRRVRDLLETGSIRGTPLQVLEQVRNEIQKTEFAGLLKQHPSPLLDPAPASSFSVPLILSGVIRFTWPYLLAAFIVSAVIGGIVYSQTGLFWSLVAFAFSTFVSTVLFVVAIGYLYGIIRQLEATDLPDDSAPEPHRLSEVVQRESRTEQNHLFGISVMKRGFVRNFVIRVVFWFIVQGASTVSRPGFLGELGTIHFARWVLLPGTDKLLFFSNYGGSWESYLEDFITKAHGGLTGVWSNTVGFPRTTNVFQDGATDGDRFKQWARRQQFPTRFWYSAYPHLTTARIRLNSAIRQGLVSAATEDAAAEWLSSMGSRPRSGANIENYDVQAILFGGFRDLNHGVCLLLRLPDSPDQAREWLSRVESGISFGDTLPADIARLFALTSTGLRKLGCEESNLDTFPIAFRQGMSAPVRAAILNDTGPSKPELWWWGYGKNAVDATLLLYSDTSGKLDADVAKQIEQLRQLGGDLVYTIPLAEYNPAEPVREPFGFVDGISQPIIKGTRRWISESDANHVVEPGEFLLGYLDNRGYLPLTPTFPATSDPHNILTAYQENQPGDLPNFSKNTANGPRDFGRNGTFLVIRQLEQDVELFNQFLTETAKNLAGRQGIPSGFTPSQIEQWLAAKIVGRWKDGTSLVRYPHEPGSGWTGATPRKPDNSFLLGAEDPLGERCPYGSHIRRTNPRESFTPGSSEQLAITNRHRILRMGRSYARQSKDGKTTSPGLLFMCLNVDIERQFEFVQQTWASARLFFGLDGEVDPMLGRGGKGGRLTIPTEQGPILVNGFKRFVTVRGGSYFFLPSRRAIRFLAHKSSLAPSAWKVESVQTDSGLESLGGSVDEFESATTGGFDLRPSWDSIH